MDEMKPVAQLRARLNNDLDDIDAAIALGNFYYDQGDAGQSIIYYRHALDINPDLASVRTDLGTMYWRNGDVSLAEQAFRGAIACDPGFGHAYLDLGLLLHRARNNVMEARAVWRKLLEIDPENDMATRARELLQETGAQVDQT
jgi:tetratricopeptide (TPR) repeat protein